VLSAIFGITVNIKNQINSGVETSMIIKAVRLFMSLSAILDNKESEGHLTDFSEGTKLEPSENFRESGKPGIDKLIFTKLLSVSRTRSPSDVRTFICLPIISISAEQVLDEFEK
tara:strand:+ start:225 stop:566 length:342 start_codon:yes stop_codon:yes gene_type:complete